MELELRRLYSLSTIHIFGYTYFRVFLTNEVVIYSQIKYLTGISGFE